MEDAGSHRVFTAQMPPRAAPFLSKKGKQNDPYNPLDCFLAFLALEAGLQGRFARDLTRPGPLARRIFRFDCFGWNLGTSIFGLAWLGRVD